MKRNFVISLFGNFIRFGMLVILICVTGSVSAHGADGQSDLLLTSNANTATTVDSAGNVGFFTSVTRGADGLGLISYYDATNRDLKVLHCGNAACNSGNISTTVDSSADVGSFGTSITRGADGLGLISYYDGTNSTLKVLHCGNAACNSGNISTTVDSWVGFAVGRYSSVTIGADGLGLISYYDGGLNALKVLHCGNAACNSGNIRTTVDRGGWFEVGFFTSITIGADGLGLISYYEGAQTGDLKVLHCGNVTCSSGNTATTVDSAGIVGSYSSVTIGADGRGLISYYDATNKDLKVLHCGNAACNSGNISTTVDSAGNVGQYTSITLGTDGLGLISYQDALYGYLKTLHCGNAACNSGNIITHLDGAGGFSVGQYTSLTLGADGLGLISYLDVTYSDLKVLHCGSAACTDTPYTIKLYLPLVLK